MSDYKIQIIYDTNNSKLNFSIYENNKIRINPNLSPVLRYINNRFDMNPETLDYSFVKHLFELIPNSNEITLELKTNLSKLQELFTERVNKIISEYDKLKDKKVNFVFSQFELIENKTEELSDTITPYSKYDEIKKEFLDSEYSDYKKALSYYFDEMTLVNHPDKNIEALELLTPLARKYNYNNSLLLKYFHILIQENLNNLDNIEKEIRCNFSDSLQSVKIALLRIALIQQNISEAEAIKNEIEKNYNDIISLSYCSLVYLAMYSKTTDKSFFEKAEELVAEFKIKREQDKFENSWIYLIQNLINVLKHKPKDEPLDKDLIYGEFCSTNYSNIGLLEDCAYRTISEAINSNNENQVVNIYPGKYYESFVINHKIQLIGMVKENTILIVPTDASLDICGDCTLKNLMLTNNRKFKEGLVPEELQNSKPIITIASNCKLDNLTITESRGNAIEINSGSPKISNCTISNNAKIGILLNTKTIFTNPNEKNIELYNNTPTYNFNNYGFNVGLGENPTIEDCRFINNKIGILLSPYSKVSIISSEINHSGIAGIKICVDSYPIINNCKFVNNEYGIEIEKGFVSSGLKAQNLSFKDNKTDYPNIKEAQDFIDINSMEQNDIEEIEQRSKAEEIKFRINNFRKKVIGKENR